MKSRVRGAVVGLMSASIAGLALVAAPPASANGTAVPLPESGSGSESWAVTTSGGCASATATHYIIRLSGGGLREPINLSGLQPLSAIPALPSGTTPMTIQVPTNLGDAITRGVSLPGVFDVSVICRTAFNATALATFAGKITILETSEGITFKAGAQPIQVTNSVKPKISGQAKPGSTLTVSTGTWSPDTATFTVTWKIGGKQVGTGLTYRVKPADRGKTVVAEVTGASPGLISGKASASIKISR